MRKKYKILESQINNAAPNYVGYEEISPEDGSFAKFSIDKLKKDYVRNSNIDDCDGYVIVRNKSEKLYYSTYISCKGIYKTKGYGSEESGKEDKQPTQSENAELVIAITELGIW